MRREKRLMTMYLPLLLTLGACGGGGSGGSGGDAPPPTAPPPASTYSVTLTGIELERSADQQDLAVTGLPAEGATLTID